VDGLGRFRYMTVSVQRGGQFRYMTTSVHIKIKAISYFSPVTENVKKTFVSSTVMT